MKYKITDGLKISDIILGTDYVGTLVSKKDALRMFDIFKSEGGTCLDTAKLYTDGMSEEIIGDWLKESGRDKMIISTKGAHPNRKTMNVSRLSKAELEEDLNSSLKRLKTDFIDIYFLHRDDKNKPAGEIIESLNSFIKQGKIRTLGASNWTAERIAEANRYAEEKGLKGFCISQIKYSLAVTNPSYADDPTLVEMNGREYDFYKKSKLAVFAFASQGKGFFSKLAQGEEFLSEKAKERYFCEKNLERFKAVEEIKKAHGVSSSAAVLSFIYSDKNINASAIIGAKNENQLKDCLSASDFMLSEKEIEYLKNI